MKLIRLTAVSDMMMIPIISPNWVTGMEVRRPPDFGTVVYTARQGLYHVVKETPEQIEEMLSGDRITDLDLKRMNIDLLAKFAQWLSERGGLNIGESYMKAVDQYLIHQSKQ